LLPWRSNKFIDKSAYQKNNLAKIITLDNSLERLESVEQNTQPFNIKTIEIIEGNAQRQDWRNGELFDKILLDAPCSATGVIRRHPDIKLLRKPKDITALAALQKDILENLWLMLKPGGILLYTTCSILKSENEQQIEHFLNNHQNAKEIKINLNWGIDASVGKQNLPSHEFDGFYYAKLKKNNGGIALLNNQNKISLYSQINNFIKTYKLILLYLLSYLALFYYAQSQMSHLLPA
jgi:16S rRNA C967 or C1407 C5-methylase (RsmB/RsmF family)